MAIVYALPNQVNVTTASTPPQQPMRWWIATADVTPTFCRRSLHALRKSLKQAMFELKKSPTGQQLTAVRVYAKQGDNAAFYVRK